LEVWLSLSGWTVMGNWVGQYVMANYNVLCLF